MKPLLLGITAALFTASAALGQFSPGELSKVHAHLEGMGQCTQCHELGEKLSGKECLDCHLPLKKRIQAGSGFHSSSSVKGKKCAACHLDHKGRNFSLVKWENGGRENFNHVLTGYALKGSHKKVECRSCHTAVNIADSDVKKQDGKSLSVERTFLGLAQTCQNCHLDEHRGQFQAACSTCHDFEDWKKSADSQFNHNTARFRLTGKHANVACVQCHPTVTNQPVSRGGKSDPDFVRFRDLPFKACTSCHADPHQNQFGNDCTKCHNTTGWANIKSGAFDHNKTRFPLKGLHRVLGCENCHTKSGKTVYKGLAHEKCQDCHGDAHVGQFAERKDAGDCASCHSEAGFLPPGYGVERHNTESEFVLAGAHVAVACNSCHVQTEPGEIKQILGLEKLPEKQLALFVLDNRKCTDCHVDPHKGQFEEKIEKGGCETCHNTDGWEALKFDHDKDADFPLEGKHGSQPCSKCHFRTDVGTASERTRYKGLPTFCEDCHADVHLGQFAQAEKATPDKPRTDCARCHNAEGFKPTSFDHNQHSRFTLTGAHQNVLCTKCHVKVSLAGGQITPLYKPLSMKCQSCHSDL